MKNQYFGDVNDYRKYWLLRQLTARSRLRLGICWMLTDDDGSGDGRKRAYLDDPATWRGDDPPLFDALTRLRAPRVRAAVEQAARWQVMPGAATFDRRLTDDRAERRAYFAAAWRALDGRPLLFFDPDNGIEVPSVPAGRRGSSRYVYWAELVEAWEQGHSLVVYQHFPRVQRQAFIAALRAAASARLPGAAVFAFAASHTLFLITARPRHTRALARAIEGLRYGTPQRMGVWT